MLKTKIEEKAGKKRRGVKRVISEETKRKKDMLDNMCV